MASSSQVEKESSDEEPETGFIPPVDSDERASPASTVSIHSASSEDRASKRKPPLVAIDSDSTAEVKRVRDNAISWFLRPYYPSTPPSRRDAGSSTAPKPTKRPRTTADQSEPISESEVKAYVHTVIWFPKITLHERGHRWVVEELHRLCKQLRSYAVHNRVRHDTSTTYFGLCCHYFGSDRRTLQFIQEQYSILGGGQVFNYDKDPVSFWNQENVDSTERINPHIHVVWWRNSRNTSTGLPGLISKFKQEYEHDTFCRASVDQCDNQNHRITGPIASTEKVKCLHSLREYLHQGRGRYLDAERIGGDVEEALYLGKRVVHPPGDKPDILTCAIFGEQEESSLDANSAGDPGVEREEGLGGESIRSIKPAGPGEFLTQQILRFGRPSINQFEETAAGEPRLRDLMFKQNYDTLIRKAYACARAVVKYEEFSKLAKTAFQNASVYIKQDQCLSPWQSYLWLQKILDHNHIDFFDFVSQVENVMDRYHTKLNTLLFFGPPNAGKTLIAESICKAGIFYANIQKFSKGANFVLQDAVGCRSMMINEPRFTDEWVETLKNVFEGCETTVDVKFKTGYSLDRTPVIVTTNNELATYVQHQRHIADAAFKARYIRFEFSTYPELKNCKGHLHPGLWYIALCKLYQIVLETTEIEEEQPDKAAVLREYLTDAPPDFHKDIIHVLEEQGGDV